MSQATNEHSTASVVSRSPSRRSLFGAGAALLLSAPVLAAIPNAPGDDADLLAMCRTFHEHDAIIRAWNAGSATETEGEAANAAWWRCINALMAMRANTLPGLAAQADCAFRAAELVADSENAADDLGRVVLRSLANWRVAA